MTTKKKLTATLPNGIKIGCTTSHDYQFVVIAHFPEEVATKVAAEHSAKLALGEVTYLDQIRAEAWEGAGDKWCYFVWTSRMDLAQKQIAKFSSKPRYEGAVFSVLAVDPA